MKLDVLNDRPIPLFPPQVPAKQCLITDDIPTYATIARVIGRRLYWWLHLGRMEIRNACAHRSIYHRLKENLKHLLHPFIQNEAQPKRESSATRLPDDRR